MLQAEVDNVSADLMALVFGKIRMMKRKIFQSCRSCIHLTMTFCNDGNVLCPLFMKPLGIG